MMIYAQTSYTPADSQATGKRLDNIGWAVFFILTGALWLVPESEVPPGTWFIGVGLLLLGLNAVRRIGSLPVSGFGTILGVLALAAGVSAFLGIEVPIVAIGLILLGLGLLARELGARRA
jgi:hypothetical protein